MAAHSKVLEKKHRKKCYFYSLSHFVEAFVLRFRLTNDFGYAGAADGDGKYKFPASIEAFSLFTLNLIF